MSQSVVTRPKLRLILNHLGHAKQDGYEWMREYVDPQNRIRIVGFINPHESKFTQIYVELNLGQANESSPGFLIPRQVGEAKAWTLVDVSTQEINGISTYQRPGKWLEFVAALANDIEQKQTEKRKLHHSPVSDHELFKDH
jgi:hypothetical protein